MEAMCNQFRSVLFLISSYQLLFIIQGFVGTYVVKELLDSGYRVRATGRQTSKSRQMG